MAEIKKKTDRLSTKDYDILLRESLTSGNTQVLTTILEANADVLLRSTNSPYLHMAIRQEVAIPGNTGIDSIMSRWNPLSKSLSTSSRSRNLPSTERILGSIDMVKTLLKYNANPLSLDELQNTSLHLACQEGSVPMLALLLSSMFKAVPNINKKSLIDVWSKDKADLDTFLDFYLQVYIKSTGRKPLFGSYDVPDVVVWKIFSFLDKTSLIRVIGVIDHQWRMLQKEYLQKYPINPPTARVLHKKTLT